MRTMILTCNTGEGHNSSAAAIKEAFTQNNMDCDIVDTLGFFSDKMSEFICNWHVRIYRHAPKMFRNGYAYAENHTSSLEERNWLNRSLAIGAERLYEMLAEVHYDQIICVHVFAVQFVTELKRSHEIHIPTSFIATDYTCSPFTGDSEIDTYFIPDQGLIDEYAGCGIPRKKIIPSGLPVRHEFHEHLTKEEAKNKLGFPLNKRNVLLMCGSMGCGPIEKLAHQLCAALPGDCILTAVCGTNEKLYRSLTKSKVTNLRVYGFTDEIPLLMDSAEVFLTKPGGISISEAAAKRLPMIFIDVVGGCEAANLHYFIARGWAETRNNTKDIVRCCVRLLQAPALLSEKAEALANAFAGEPAERIYAHLCNVLQEEAVQKGAAVSARYAI